jgi:hypothetical protein
MSRLTVRVLQRRRGDAVITYNRKPDSTEYFNNTLQRVAPCERLDIVIQLTQPIRDHRYLTVFDGFATFSDVLDPFAGRSVNTHGFCRDDEL